MNVHKGVSSTRPRNIGWLTSAISIVLIIGASVMILLFVDLQRKQLAYERLATGLFAHDYVDSESSLQHVTESWIVTERLRATLLETPNKLSLETVQAESEILLQIIINLSKGDTTQAIAQFSTLDLDRKDSPLSGRLRSMLSSLEQEFSALSRVVHNLRSAEQQLKATENTILELRKEFLLVAEDLSELFTLAPEEDASGKALLAYDSGLLKNYPKLRGLRDNISTLIDLKEKLTLAGGHVKVEGANAHEQFTDKFSAIGKASEDILQQHREAQAKRDELRLQFDALHEQEMEQQEALIYDLSDLLLDLLRYSNPQLTPVGAKRRE